MPLLALRGLGVPFRHVFASDISQSSHATLRAHAPPDVMYSDLRARNLEDMWPVDLYIAGFPCQSFSLAGLRDGFRAREGNGFLFFHIYAYIARWRPRVFILENVAGLLSVAEGECFLQIWQTLRSLRHYNVSWALLNTLDHRVPQNRPRLFFVGIDAAYDLFLFWFPSPLPRPSIERFLDVRPGRPSFVDLPSPGAAVARGTSFVFCRGQAALGMTLSMNHGSWIATALQSGATPCTTCPHV